ncbi:MAG TPA: class I SAM-dependent methyltransferase [Clostridiales bacterium]|nr:class I SAM-dependent methyltransferase [Clostridiales bacterium]
MDEVALKNKKAWEYRAYEFWNMNYGTPKEKAVEILHNPKACLRYHQKYFDDIKGSNIANVCGSNGRIAVPLAVLGAVVTIFDISEENQKYALELADSAGVSIIYEVGDFNNVDLKRHGNVFDIAYLEGGILHYFHNLNLFFSKLYGIIKPGGKLILSDFHPFRKIVAMGQIGKSTQVTDGDYFDISVFNGEVAYKSHFPQDEQQFFPDCSLRYYTLSEIINAAINTGFNIREFIEHPNWENKKVPGEFTIIGLK